MTSRFRPRPRLPCAIAFVVAVGCGRGGELDAQAVGTGGAGGDAATEAGAASGKGGAAGTAGAAGTGGPAGGAGGEGGAGGGGTGGPSGAAGGAGEAGASGAAGAPSKLAFAGPDIVEFGPRRVYCIVPVAWSKDGRMDVVTVHDWSPGYTPSSEYKAYYDLWRIVNGKLTIVAGPVSLEQSPDTGAPTGTCTTTDLDHDGVVEVTTLAGNHWIRPGAPLGKAFISSGVSDLNADEAWEVPIFSAGGKMLAGRAVETKDGVTWTLGAAMYSLTPPFPYGALLAGDFDGDGREDLAVHDVSNTNQVLVLRAAPGGPQLLPVTTALDDFFNTIVGDMNGDGRADLIAQGKKGYQVAYSDGKGGFTVQVLFSNTAVEGLAAVDSFTVGDVSGDGRPDLILDSPAGVYVVESDGPGTWRPVRLAIDWKHWAPGGGLGEMHMFRVVDMDGDGKKDLVATRDFSLVAFRNITPSQ